MFLMVFSMAFSSVSSHFVIFCFVFCNINCMYDLVLQVEYKKSLYKFVLSKHLNLTFCVLLSPN